MSTQQPESLRLAHDFDHPIPPDWSDMVAAVKELLQLHAENEALQQVYYAALEEARSAINSMKVEAETAGQGDEQMMLEACETISNEGLQADMAIRAALASAPRPVPSAAEAPLPLLVRDIAADLGTTPIQVCTALAQLGFGGHSVNMAVTPRMAQSLRAHFASPTPQADSQPAKVELFNPLEGGNLETELQMAAVIALRDSQPALPEITAEDRSFLHYNPNTDDIVEWVQHYASAAITADRAMRAKAAPAAVAGPSDEMVLAAAPAPAAQGDALDVEIAALESSCAHLGRLIDELRPDAERYQYLRERDLDTIRQGGVFAGRTPDNVVLNGDDLDAAIDAARAKAKEGDQHG